jgi:hypothetical protein
MNKKLDDGNPDSGFVMSYRNLNQLPFITGDKDRFDCASTASTIAYNLTNSETDCALIFKLGF